MNTFNPEQFRREIDELEGRKSMDDPINYEPLVAQARAALAEIERLQTPLEGDVKAQAAAWCAVYEALAKAGLHSFVGTVPFGGRRRAVEFIAHMAAEIERLRGVVDSEAEAERERCSQRIERLRDALKPAFYPEKSMCDRCIVAINTTNNE